MRIAGVCGGLACGLVIMDNCDEYGGGGERGGERENLLFDCVDYLLLSVVGC